MTTEQLIKTGQQTALISFLLGSVIFGLYFLTSSDDILFLGYGFIAITGVINIVILISILIKAQRDNGKRKKLLITCGIMLLNIPVMLLYCCTAIILLNTMRITFTNSTQAILKNIHIVGCGGGHIDEMKIGESKTIWVDIIGDCSISINYLYNGQRKEEIIAGYVTNNMGQKITHNIGVQNKE